MARLLLKPCSAAASEQGGPVRDDRQVAIDVLAIRGRDLASRDGLIREGPSLLQVFLNQIVGGPARCCSEA